MRQNAFEPTGGMARQIIGPAITTDRIPSSKPVVILSGPSRKGFNDIPQRQINHDENTASACDFGAVRRMRGRLVNPAGDCGR